MLKGTRIALETLQEENQRLRAVNTKLLAAALTASNPVVGGSFLVANTEVTASDHLDLEADIAAEPKFL